MNEKDAHTIEVGKDLTLFYDVTSGLKVKGIILKNINGKIVEQTLLFSDYKPVEGILFPHTSNHVLTFRSLMLSS